MEIRSSKQEEEFKATTFLVNNLKLHTGPYKVFIQEFVWSSEILIPNVLDIIYFFYFDNIISMSIPFKGRLFCQNPMYNCTVIGVER